MQLAELSGARRFAVIDAPEIATPGPGEVQVEVRAIGICGSDVHYFSEGFIGDTPCVYPMVLGHEPAGVVRKTGPGVSGWAAGDRAVLEPALYCYHCEFCMSGRHNVCANVRFLSTPGEPGFFREYVNLPAHNLMPLPANLSEAEGALVEPFAVVLHSLEFAAVRPGDTAAVFGAGPIGFLTMAALKLAGAGRVIAVEPVAHRREMARAAGADDAIDPQQGDAAVEILNATGKRGVDVAIDCAAKPGTINQCIAAVRNAGRVVVTGIPSTVEVALNFSALRRKEIAVYNVRRSNHESEAALRILAAHASRFAPVLTHRKPLAGIQSAFEQLESYSDGAGKIVLYP